MRHQEWTADIRRRWGVHSDDDAARLLSAVMEGLREQLDPLDARALAAALPDETGAPLRARGPLADGTWSARDFAARIAELAALPAAAALEGSEVVMAELAETLPDELLLRLRKHLAPELAEMLTPPATSEPPETPERRRAPEEPTPSRRTLAEGRPGSLHPLSEARPEHAHANSLARSDEPHADTKLSGAHGLTQERERESLATGRGR